MDSSFGPILLLVSCVLVSHVVAPGDGVQAIVKTTTNLVTAPLNLEKYYLTNFYSLHFDCYRFCWVVLGKKRRNECLETKKIKCQERRNYSYGQFVVFHLTKLGVGKVASKVLGVPIMVVGTGVQAGVAAASTVASGAVEGVKEITKVGSQVGQATLDVAKNGVETTKAAVEDTKKATSTVLGGMKEAADTGLAGATEKTKAAAGEALGAASAALQAPGALLKNGGPLSKIPSFNKDS
ncbi:uncharacterized protein LOC128990544 [Macrosteles quadrilineatus]|uniref:uncharacterized protein LOC128990544 n=1 Tax=Macrosteles quadrilineatus TaxID=74068 RepID=UPI0023E225DB|nr:uncharacterized protein LOC128990544 [Macrosteles quadrilineatus]